MGRTVACVSAGPLSEAEICVRALHSGGVVAVPTDTYFGLLADPYSARAMATLRRLKHVAHPRPWPLLLPIGYDHGRLDCVFSASGLRLASRFWPGKLTLIVSCNGPLGKLAGRSSDGALGLRVPSGPEALLRLLDLWGGPLTGTSANPAGLPPAENIEQVRAYYPDELEHTLEGTVPGGAPSTVVDTVGLVTIVRSGAVPDQLIREEMG